MIPLEAKGKSKYTKGWIEGKLVMGPNFDPDIFSIPGGLHEIEPSTICMWSGKESIKKNKIYEYDILFEELEEEKGDKRNFFICLWIDKWARYVLLSSSEFQDYSDRPEEFLDENDPGDFGVDGIEVMHCKGNEKETPGLFDKMVDEEETKTS